MQARVPIGDGVVNVNITLNIERSINKSREQERSYVSTIRHGEVYRESPPVGLHTAPCGRDDIATDDAKSKRFEVHINDPSAYFDMQQKSKGRVLIINNEFPNDPNFPRVGSEKDVQNLEAMFKGLGGKAPGSQVDVEIARNKSECAMKAYLKAFVADPKEKISFYAIVIMSHGYCAKDGIDSVHDSNYSPIDIMELVDIFKSEQHLQQVPVLMFFQTCRGGLTSSAPFRKVDHLDHIAAESNERKTKELGQVLRNRLLNVLPGSGIIGRENKLRRDELDTAPTLASGHQIDQADRNNVMRPSTSASAGPDDQLDRHAREYVINEPNMLISFSTSQGWAAVRNHKNGSWFIEDLCRTFTKYAAERDVVELMDEVHNVVHRRRSPSYPNIVIACETAETLKKKLFFFPGLPEK